MTNGQQSTLSVEHKENVDSELTLEEIVGLVTDEELDQTRSQMTVRFSEVGGPQMNMIAFD